MLIYATPGSGKSTFCLRKTKDKKGIWLDGDNILIELMKVHFASDQVREELDKCSTDSSNYDPNISFGKLILSLYEDGFGGACEKSYTEYYNRLLSNKEKPQENILFGTMRFMFLAHHLFIESDRELLTQRKNEADAIHIIEGQNRNILRWALHDRITLLHGKFISEVL